MLLLIVGAVAALPTLGVVGAADCAFASTATPTHTPEAGATPSAPATLSMSLRAGDMRFADALRVRVEDNVRLLGTAKIIDNPQQYPRATITMSAVDGRWTPFWARLRIETKVQFDRSKDARRKSEPGGGGFSGDGGPATMVPSSSIRRMRK